MTTTVFEHPTLRLGHKFAPRDDRTLRFAKYTPELPPPPSTVDYLSRMPVNPMYGNDKAGDCEVAACAHLEIALSTYGSGKPVVVTDADVIAAYSAITGYNPATGANDTGTTSLDMLNYWRKQGVGGHKITAYVQVDVNNRTEVKQAIALGGGLLIGADLPRSAATQIDAGRHWTVSRGAAGQPGTWGGHAMHVGRYSSRYAEVTTWGRRQLMTWAWFETYVMEAYVPITVDWFNAAGLDPTGLNLDALMADLHTVTGH